MKYHITKVSKVNHRQPSFVPRAMDDESIEAELVELLSCHRSDSWLCIQYIYICLYKLIYIYMVDYIYISIYLSLSLSLICVYIYISLSLPLFYKCVTSIFDRASLRKPMVPSHGVQRFAVWTRAKGNRKTLHYQIGCLQSQSACKLIWVSKPWHWRQHPSAALLSDCPVQTLLRGACWSTVSIPFKLCLPNMSPSFLRWGTLTIRVGGGRVICMGMATQKNNGPTWLYYGFLQNHMGLLC